MAKRVIKSDRIREIIKNISADFRHTNELGDYALLFYKCENDDTIRGADIDMMLEYVMTSMAELKNDLAWRQEHLATNPQHSETRVLETMFTIEQEYKELLEFLQ